jgi:predicted nucleotidyltransferase
MSESELLKLILDRIVAGFAPLKVILFGSRARSRADPDSDVDLLVVLPQAPSTRAAAVGIRRALKDLPVSKDVFVTTPEEIRERGGIVGTVLHAALRDGRVVFER